MAPKAGPQKDLTKYLLIKLLREQPFVNNKSSVTYPSLSFTQMMVIPAKMSKLAIVSSFIENLSRLTKVVLISCLSCRLYLTHS